MSCPRFFVGHPEMRSAIDEKTMFIYYRNRRNAPQWDNL